MRGANLAIRGNNISKLQRPLTFKKEQHKNKQSSSLNSAFCKITLQKPRSDEDRIVKKRLPFGVISIKSPNYSEYMVEFDIHDNSTPHFHIWRTNGYSKISDTRSSAISLTSSINRGIEYSFVERKNEVKLNDMQEVQILLFVEENRYLLFLMYNALKNGKTKSFEGLDEEMVMNLFTPKEIQRLNQKYNLLFESSPTELTK